MRVWVFVCGCSGRSATEGQAGREGVATDEESERGLRLQRHIVFWEKFLVAVGCFVASDWCFFFGEVVF